MSGLILIFLIFLGVFLGLFLTKESKEVLNVAELVPIIGGEPRLSYFTPRMFKLFEFHSDDSVRIVEIVTEDNVIGSRVNILGPYMKSDDESLDIEFINAELVERTIYTDVYRDKTWYYYQYAVIPTQNTYGYDALTDKKFLHTMQQGKPRSDRLISIGTDPQSYYEQWIAAVAIPLDAEVTRVSDYQPYRHITLENWDVYYYDTTEITSHVSFHITYDPGEDAPSLDWAEVEASR